MAKRHAVKVATAAAQAPAPDLRARSRHRLRLLLVPILSLLSAAMLNLCFAPFDQWCLAFVALAPLSLAMILSPGSRWAMLWAWLGGVAFWLSSLYWISWVDQVGYTALVLYLSLYWLAAGAVLRPALRRGMPAFLVVPVVWVALEYARAYIISGFTWFTLAHSLYQHPSLIQLTDVTGEYGPSFMIAMVSGALVDLLRLWPLLRRFDTLPQSAAAPEPLPAGSSAVGPRCRRPHALAAVFASVIAIGGSALYGQFRLHQHTTRPGPVIGLVQQAFPITLDGMGATGDKIFADHIAATDSIGPGCDLIIWPETMTPKGLNPALLDADVAAMTGPEARSLGSQFYGPDAWNKKYSDDYVRAALTREINGRDGSGNVSRYAALRAQAQQLGDLSRRVDCPLLVGTPAVHRNAAPLDEKDIWTSRNSALLFDRGDHAVAEYSKMHLVPFGEYVPFRNSWPALHKFLRSFVPPVMEQLQPGEGFEPMVIQARPHPAASRPAGEAAAIPPTPATQSVPADSTFRIAAPICYEGVFARLCRDMVMKNGVKRVDLLANISNDGWFVRRYRGSTEQSQHLVQYVFRAIETRVPVVRAVNTGISASIDSNGRILAAVQQEQGLRVMVAGTLTLDGKAVSGEEYAQNHGPQILVDSRVTLYSLIGDVFAQVVSAAAVLLALFLIWTRKRSVKGSAT